MTAYRSIGSLPRGRRLRSAGHQSNRHAGFTLIELLVVISIIALLISILLPALAAVRQAAHRAECLANQRSVATAVVNFATSNGVLPMTYDGWAMGPRTWAARQLLDDGFLEAPIHWEQTPEHAPRSPWRCPAGTSIVSGWYSPDSPFEQAVLQGHSPRLQYPEGDAFIVSFFGFNGYRRANEFPLRSNYHFPRPRPYAQLDGDLTRLVMTFDSSGPDHDNGNGNRVVARHGFEYTNMSFYDGSARTILREEVGSIRGDDGQGVVRWRIDR